MEERKQKEFKLVENNIALALNVEKQNRKEEEYYGLKRIDEKINAVKVDVISEEAQRTEELKRQQQVIAEQITNFQKELNNERRTRYASNINVA